MSKKKPTLMVRLIMTMVVASTVLIGSVLTIALFIINNILDDQLNEKLILKSEINATNMNATINGLMDTMDSFVFDLQSTTDMSIDIISNTIDAKINSLPNKSSISAFYIGIGETNYLYETFGWIPDSSYDVKSRSWYTGAIGKSGLNVISYADANTGIYAICVSKAVNLNDGKQAVIAIDMEITSSLEAMKMHESTEYFFVQDVDGIIIFHDNKDYIPHDNIITYTKDVSNDYSKLSSLSQSNVVTILDYNNEEYVFTVNNIDNGGFKIYTGVQTSIKKEQLNNILGISILIFIGLLVVASLVFSFEFRRISRPIKKAADQLGRMSAGEFELTSISGSKSNIREIEFLNQYLIELSTNTRNMIIDIGKTLAFIGDGNLGYTTSMSYPGEYSKIKDYMDNISQKLSAIVAQMRGVSVQVATSSEQLSDSSNSLSASSSEQAMLVKELADSLIKISGEITLFADTANKSSKNTSEVGVLIDDCDKNMNEMIIAMDEVYNSSNQILNIVKSINDIAFQTNILALNAAVEAARAGEAGKGFAVVADEVRTLANSSGDAAKNANTLIDAMIASITKGTNIAKTAADSLNKVVTRTQSVVESVNEISAGSSEHAISLNGLSGSIDKISNQVENNSAVAEESAASSEELSSQASMLNNLIEQLNSD